MASDSSFHWPRYLALLLIVFALYYVFVVRRRLASVSPHQRHISLIAMLGELAAVLAAATAVYVGFFVDRSSCQFGQVGPMRLRYANGGNPQYAEIAQVHTVHCADSQAAQQALRKLQRSAPNGPAARYAQHAYSILHEKS